MFEGWWDAARTTAIKELILEANIIKSDAFGVSSKEDVQEEIEQEDVQPEKESDIIKVDLGNGQVGRISKSQISSGE